MSHPLLNFATKIAIPLKTPSTAKSPWPPFSLRDPSSFDSPPFAAVDLRATGNGCFHHQQTIWNIYKAKKNYIELFGPFKSMPFTYLEFPRKSITPPPPPQKNKENIHLTKSSRNSSWAWRWYPQNFGGWSRQQFCPASKNHMSLLGYWLFQSENTLPGSYGHQIHSSS